MIVFFFSFLVTPAVKGIFIFLIKFKFHVFMHNPFKGCIM